MLESHFSTWYQDPGNKKNGSARSLAQPLPLGKLGVFNKRIAQDTSKTREDGLT